MKIRFIYLVICFGTTHLFSQDAAIWNQYVDAKANGTEPILPDFSYAGYNYSETPLPDISDWQVFDVTDYGAVPDDGQYDDAQVQATVDAAEANGGGVVYFPAGRFLFSPSNYLDEIRIKESNIVLKGAGSDVGGTELFVDNMYPNEWKFEFKPNGNLTGSKITSIVAQAQRETFEVEVADAANLSEGQEIIIRGVDAVDFAEDYFAPREFLPVWTTILDSFPLNEIHTIASINGNTITFREPLHITLKPSLGEFNIHDYNHLSENGIEDIRFIGGWLNYPEVFKHHENDIHNYGWQAVRMRNVSNGWVKDCVFHSWNRAIALNQCSKVTVENALFTGKKGHFGPSNNSCYGSLIKNCEDNTGNHHGASVSSYSSGTVFQNFQMAGDQRIDTHGKSPYATLYDNVKDGYMHDNGAAIKNLPNHGRDLVFWNFRLSDEDEDNEREDYDFWLDFLVGNSGRHFYADPIFVGLHGDPVNLANTGVNESQGTPVTPTSLFDAQLACRLNAEDFDRDGVIDTRDLDDDNDGILDSVEGTGDFDQDGIPNNKDLDSDNDSCPDAIEGGGNFDYGDLNDIGAIQGTINGTGITIIGQQSLGSAKNSNTITCCSILDFDHDSDGVSDMCDFDNDNDGITDKDEETCEIDTEFIFLGLSNQNRVAQWSVSNGFYSGIFTAVTDHPEGPWLNQKTSSINYVRVKFAEAAQKIYCYYKGDKITDDVSITLSTIGSGTKLKFWGQNEVINNEGDFGLNTLNNTLSIGDVFSANYGDEIRDDNVGELVFVPHDFNTTGHHFEINIDADTPFTGLADYSIMLRSFCDIDSDNIPNHLDTDSDNDDCADAIEGNKTYLPDHLVNGSLCVDNNCVDTQGLPQVADSNGSIGPQSIGSSQDSQTQPDMDNDGISDCMDSCPDVEFNLFSFEDGAIHYETDGQIQSAQLIGPGGNVEYDSGTSILLFPSFEVLSGAQFHAYIEGCGN